MTPRPDFDGLAPYYHFLERISYGSLLHRCRTAHLDRTRGRSRALILGDGDGRFLSELLIANSEALVDCIDLSQAMTALSSHRLHSLRGRANRVRYLVGDAKSLSWPRNDYDLVVTNFFLDCFSAGDLADLAARIASATGPDALWIDGDFRIPPGRFPRVMAKTALCGMYLAFRIMTGLSVRRLTDPAPLQSACGFKRIAEQSLLRGFLSSRVWVKARTPHVTDFPDFHADPPR